MAASDIIAGVRPLLQGRTILVISPNEWGTMRLSKHHYAVKLAQRGNRVYFLNPPDRRLPERIRIERQPEAEELYTVTYRPYVPYVMRFHAPRLYARVARWHVRWLMKQLGEAFDVAWCFETNLYADLRWFGAALRIYHPVDQLELPHHVEVARSAEVVFSVAPEILDRIDGRWVPKHLVDHGLADCFARHARQRVAASRYQPHQPVRAGYLGNLFMRQVDRPIFQRIVADNPDVEFHIWGPRTPDESNVAADDSSEYRAFVEYLRSRGNVRLRGVLPPERLAEEVQSMDLFLLCYDPRRDPNAGSNSHKILEYLSTGRLVVASRVSRYADRPDLLLMPERADNTALPGLFHEAVANLDTLNAPERQRRRLDFALEHTYDRQLDRIEALLDEADLLEPSASVRRRR